jgi:hypothetical protein
LATKEMANMTEGNMVKQEVFFPCIECKGFLNMLSVRSRRQTKQLSSTIVTHVPRTQERFREM